MWTRRNILGACIATSALAAGVWFGTDLPDRLPLLPHERSVLDACERPSRRALHKALRENLDIACDPAWWTDQAPKPDSRSSRWLAQRSLDGGHGAWLAAGLLALNGPSTDDESWWAAAQPHPLRQAVTARWASQRLPLKDLALAYTWPHAATSDPAHEAGDALRWEAMGWLPTQPDTLPNVLGGMLDQSPSSPWGMDEGPHLRGWPEGPSTRKLRAQLQDRCDAGQADTSRCALFIARLLEEDLGGDTVPELPATLQRTLRGWTAAALPEGADHAAERWVHDLANNLRKRANPAVALDRLLHHPAVAPQQPPATQDPLTVPRHRDGGAWAQAALAVWLGQAMDVPVQVFHVGHEELSVQIGTPDDQVPRRVLVRCGMTWTPPQDATTPADDVLIATLLNAQPADLQTVTAHAAWDLAATRPAAEAVQLRAWAARLVSARPPTADASDPAAAAWIAHVGGFLSGATRPALDWSTAPCEGAP